eukprot:2241147-Pleurochrysis_carterae.AAC.1
MTCDADSSGIGRDVSRTRASPFLSVTFGNSASLLAVGPPVHDWRRASEEGAGWCRPACAAQEVVSDGALGALCPLHPLHTNIYTCMRVPPQPRQQHLFTVACAFLEPLGRGDRAPLTPWPFTP